MAPSNNNITMDSDELVTFLNDKMADLMVPATVFIVVLMVTGTIGNLMVCFYYGFKMKKTTNSFFIVVLALYDLIMCVICMPMEIIDIEFYYTFKIGMACKIFRLLSYFTSIGSILTLLVIAIDRYRRIRKPTETQMTLSRAKVVSCMNAVVAVIFSWPSVILYGAIRVEIPNELGQNVTGVDCTATKDETFKPYLWSFNGIHFVSFIIITTILIIMYVIICSSMFKHRRKMSVHRQASLETPCFSSPNNSVLSNESSESDPLSNTAEGVISMKPGRIRKISRKISTESTIRERIQNYHTTSVRVVSISADQETIKVTLVMIAITSIFILSFLPYLSLTAWRIKAGKHEAQVLDDPGLVGFKIGSRSILLNSALNPWIYGIFNRSFRLYFVRLFTCKL